MKKRIIFLMLIASIHTGLKAQVDNCPPDPDAPIAEYCEDGHGISTDPSNLVNEDCPDLKNDFEWRVKHLQGGGVPDEQYFGYDGDGIMRRMRNPFNDTDPSAEYSHLSANHESNYNPEDGWEMLKVDFGTLSNIGLTHTQDPGQNIDIAGPKLPYLILYNKYSGTFRFFGALLGDNQNYETIKIELRIPNKSPDKGSGINNYQDDLKATNLLSAQGDALQPLDQETEETSLIVFAKCTNNSNSFFYFDIPTAYDPCLCNIRSQLDITFEFVKTAQIAINGEPTKGITTETKSTATNPGLVYAKKVTTRVLAATASTVLAIKSGGTIINFKAYTDLVGLIKDNPNVSTPDRANLTKLQKYLECSSNFAKVVKANYKKKEGNPKVTKEVEAAEKANYARAEKLLNGSITYLSALTSGCGGSDKAGTAVTGAFEASGTYTESGT